MRLPDGLLSTLLEVGGLGLAVVTAFTVSVSAGLVALGVLLVVVGAVLGERTRL